MYRAFIVFLLVEAALTLACSRTNVSDQANANSSLTTVPIAEITDAQQAMALGDQLLENNETDKAIEAYLRATELDPNLADAWFKLGIAYGLIEKEQELAAQNDVNATDESGKQEKPNSEKAFRKAVEAYKKILGQNPEDHAALFNLGRSYNKLNEDQDAAKALKEAVKLNPEDSEYQTELGAILIKLAQYREAIPPLNKALALDPDNSRAAELLEDAQAGRSRIDYVGSPKSNSNANANTNANSNTNANVSAPANSNTSSANKPANPPATPKPTPKPDKTVPKPQI
jgi:tetratricopeptide (TPR) repeat protein